MGSIMSSVMDENMKKQQAFMLENQELMLSRQLAMQNAIRERQMAMQLARSREMLNWTGSLGTILIAGCLIGAIKEKNPKLFVPVLPISTVLGYQFDMSYGSKMPRIRQDAESILDELPEMIELPKGMPDLSEIESRRIAAVANKKL